MAGDYLLARASVLLARLGDVQVVEIMATALDSLVQGEIMQLKMDPEKLLDISLYLRKSYYKTASLITNACKSCAILGGHEFDSDVSVGDGGVLCFFCWFFLQMTQQTHIYP